MAKKPLTFSEMLQRQIDKQNKRAAESKAAMNRLLAQYQASKAPVVHTDDSGSFECPLGSACDDNQ
jgi:hypothetical protein